MMIRKKIFRSGLALSIILICQNALSQEKYLQGYVINLKGDTLKGFIDYRNWKINPDFIEFKERLEDNPVSYRPIDILEFKVKDEIYVSATVNIETSPRNTDALNYDNAMHLQVITAFLQTLFRGKKSLYYYFNYGKDYFYIMQDSTIELLLYKRYLYVQKDNSILMENKAYQGQLNLYLKDCQGIEARLSKTLYEQSDLSDLFRFYYERTQSEGSFKKDVEKLIVETGLLAGGSLTTVKFSGPSYFTETDFSASVNFSAGLYLEMIIPRSQRKWSISNELIFSTYDITGIYKNGSADNYTQITNELGYTYLKINNLARFKYPVGHSYLYFNGGLSNGFVIQETNSKSVFTKFYSTERTEEGAALEDTKKYELGFIAGGGIKSGRYSAEARYEIGNGMSKFLDITARTHRIFLLLGFRF